MTEFDMDMIIDQLKSDEIKNYNYFFFISFIKTFLYRKYFFNTNAIMALLMEKSHIKQ